MQQWHRVAINNLSKQILILKLNHTYSVSSALKDLGRMHPTVGHRWTKNVLEKEPIIKKINEKPLRTVSEKD